jgi:hypothetical protein
MRVDATRLLHELDVGLEWDEPDFVTELPVRPILEVFIMGRVKIGNNQPLGTGTYDNFCRYRFSFLIQFDF